MKDDQRGSGSLLSLSVATLAVTVVLALAGGFSLVMQKRSLQSVADLVAINAATYRQYALDACQVATEIAQANSSRLDNCTLNGMDVQVRVSSAVFPLLKAGAKAGPSPGCG